MKKNNMKVIFLIYALILSHMSMAQDLQEIQAQRMKTANNGNPEEKRQLISLLHGELESYKTEKEYRNAQYVFYAAGLQETADSLKNLTIKKFPKGSAARDSFLTEVYYKKETANEKEKAYQTLLKKWPIARFPGEEINYDYALANLALALAKENRAADAINYLDQLKERFWRGNAYLPVAGTLLSQGDTARALTLIKTIVDDGRYYHSLPENEKTSKTRFAAMGYAEALSQLVAILADQKKYEEALALIEQTMKTAPEQMNSLTYVYYKCLAGVGRNLEAYNELSKLYKEGRFEFEPNLRDLYIQLNHSDSGWDRYLASLQEDLVSKIKEHIKSLEQHNLSPDFELTDLQGKRVSLQSLKGKTIVLDFWATWCQPCKKSFPGMKAAQTLYENDPDVVFLFIDTWERDKNYKQQVAHFLENNQYPFHVLFDDAKHAATGKLVAEKFGIKGIPAKFIIDKEGYIRYALLGSSPMENYIKMEMKELIEGAKKPYHG